MSAASSSRPLHTPDGRYIVVRQRLWRAANPTLSAQRRQHLTEALMHARRAVKTAQRDGDASALIQARQAVQAAKVALGERGPVWWTDGASDYNRYLVKNTPYAAWFSQLP
ncbi:hypothetical protein LJR143_001441 [Pseudoxanthomonas sp. LjRoot143]|uniref:hypothetical protein n=1 Tax=Pseudoxanthomonas sp. LjRoot143 TaxID=3342266 RepID=UPI003ECD5533